ncbi:MAG: pilus assembly protein PilM [Candidatus Omnitrophota bacterium]
MLKGNQVGIYLSQGSIELIEAQAKQLARYYSLALPAKQEQAVDFSQDDKLKMVVGLNKSIREALIETKDVILSIAAEKLVIRYFQIPVMPKAELDSTVNFEARRYIPFNIEELAFDYQSINLNKNLGILFVAIKRDFLDFIVSVFTEAKLNLLAIEPASFSLLRVLKLSRHIGKNNLVIVDFNPNEGGDITILEAGFPRFNRDIKFLPGLPLEMDEKLDSTSAKLITEIRLSLEFYFRRQPYQKFIEKLILVTQEDSSELKDSLSRELGFPIVIVRPAELLINIKEPMGLGLVKAYGASLRNKISLPFSIDLLKNIAVKTYKPKAIFPKVAIKIDLLSLLKPELIRTLIICCLGVVLVYLFGLQKIILEKKNLESLRQKDKRAGYFSGLSSKDLKIMQENYEKKLSALETLAGRRIYLTKKLNTLASVLPDGCWLKDISFQKSPNSIGLVVRGSVYHEDETKEFGTVNQLLSRLKNDASFLEGFTEISLSRVNKNKAAKWIVTDFEISCR